MTKGHNLLVSVSKCLPNGSCCMPSWSNLAIKSCDFISNSVALVTASNSMRKLLMADNSILVPRSVSLVFL